MNTQHHDHFWNSLTTGCAPALRLWLHDHGSLTQRIQQRCEKFSVQPVRSGLARIAFDEATLLGIAPHHLAYSREVFLLADGNPVVFAHSTCAREHLHDAWKAMNGLGNRSLGSLLFTHPLVIRQPLRFKALRTHHPLAGRACAVGAVGALAPYSHGLPLAGTARYACRELVESVGLKPDLQNAPATLWARRSLFTLHGAPLLVTEVFLPEILKLK